ncbi:glucosamine-6-phosphate deaminase [Paenibacillus sp. HB172176]|uniref:glucosamine-6-phosphate deaminase n=1 Tax=Paenibacillus sp. HB172176 TaxID=2493690 RepID=UPI001438DE32|nr:glucosamine-6-phosphate deaminase [Paenibacillus sp. HB172176]
MNVHVFEHPVALGEFAAKLASEVIRRYVEEQGKCRLALSTGQSQFEFFDAFAKQAIDWSKVEVFHLDEYVGLPLEHPASFRRYLKERLLDQVSAGKQYLVNGEGDIAAHVAELNREIARAPIDLALIGIGENAHIAFNDPPADFETQAPYMVVDLDEACKQQQVREGWFPLLDDVPKQAITMSVRQLMSSRTIISCVPHSVKAEAIHLTMTEAVSNLVPATILKTHGDWTLCLDAASASRLELTGAASDDIDVES